MSFDSHCLFSVESIIFIFYFWYLDESWTCAKMNGKVREILTNPTRILGFLVGLLESLHWVGSTFKVLI